jgi:hypothetical protein
MMLLVFANAQAYATVLAPCLEISSVCVFIRDIDKSKKSEIRLDSWKKWKKWNKHVCRTCTYVQNDILRIASIARPS